MRAIIKDMVCINSIKLMSILLRIYMAGIIQVALEILLCWQTKEAVS